MWPGYYNTMSPWRFIWGPWILILVIVELVLKGIALYRSARHGRKYWFVALLIVNSLGLLPLIYLIWFDKKAAPAKSRISPSRRVRSKR